MKFLQQRAVYRQALFEVFTFFTSVVRELDNLAEIFQYDDGNDLMPKESFDCEPCKEANLLSFCHS
jgi:hypothetical protein